MDGWAGFTDADLKKIKGENEKDGGKCKYMLLL